MDEQPRGDGELNELRHQIDVLRDRFVLSQKTPWGTIASVATVVAMIIIAFLALIGSRFDAVNSRIDGRDKIDAEIKSLIDKTSSEGVRRTELLATKEALNTEIQATRAHVDEIKQALNVINSELIRRRAEFVEQVELRALEKRIDEMLRAIASRIDMRLTISAFEAWKAERDRRFDELEKKQR